LGVWFNNLPTLVFGVPRAELMGAIGLLALAANLASVLLLMRYKNGDANRALGVALLAKRCDRQRRGDVCRACRLGNRQRVAGLGRSRNDGWHLPHIFGADIETGMDRIPQRLLERRHDGAT